MRIKNTFKKVPILQRKKKKNGSQPIIEKSEDELLQELVRNKVLLCQAIKSGINVSEEEARVELLKTFELIDNIANNTNDPQSAESVQVANSVIDTFLAGMNMTRDEYLEQYAVPAYREIMIIKKLGENFEQNLSEEDRLNPQLARQKYEAYVVDLIAKADIKYTR